MVITVVNDDFSSKTSYTVVCLVSVLRVGGLDGGIVSTLIQDAMGVGLNPAVGTLFPSSL